MSDSSVQDVYVEVRKRGTSNGKIEKENFETLQAIEESIKSKTKGDPTPVKYFNALMTMLNTNTGYYRSLLYLLQLILPSVPESAKQNKCSDCMEVLLQVPKCHKKTFEPAANRSLMICLVSILKAQKPSEDLWKEKNVRKGFTYLLNQCINKSPKIRHVAEDEIASIMEINHSHHIVELSNQLITFLKTLNKKYDDATSKDITNFLSLIAKVILFIDESKYDALLSLLLEIRSHKINYLEYKSLHPIEIILGSESSLSMAHVNDFLTAMLSSPVAEEATAVDIIEYIKTIAMASRRLLVGQEETALSKFTQVMEKAMQYFKSSNNELLTQLTSFFIEFYASLKQSLLTEPLVQALTEKYVTVQKEIPKDHFASFIPTLTSFLQLIGESFPTQAQELIRLLCSLYDICSGKSTIYRPIIVDALKNAILYVPIETFMKAVSMTKEDNLPDENHTFLYHILEETLCHKPCSLAFFFDYFAPVVKACQKEIAATKNVTQKRRYQLDIANIFSIFASCCVCATDAATVLPSYKKLLLRVLNDEHNFDAGIAICKALAILIRSNQQMVEQKESAVKKDREEEELLQGDDKEEDKDDDEVDEMEAPFMEKLSLSKAPKIDVKQAKKTLEALSSSMDAFVEAGYTLFDHCHGRYEKEVPKFNGVGQGGDMATVLSLRYALTVMASIVPAKELTTHYTQLVQTIKSSQDSTEMESIRQHIVAVGTLATLIQSLPSSNTSGIMECFELIKAHMDEGSIPVLQRRYCYCLLLLTHYHGAVIAKEGELVNTINLLLENLLTVSVLVRKYRIKALYYLLPHLSNARSEDLMYLVTIIPKFVLCIKDSNKVVRSICFDVIITISHLMKNATGMLQLPDGSETQASLVEYFKIMMGCLTSNTAHMKSASLMCISCVLYHHRMDESIWSTLADLIHIVYTFLEEKSRELVKACFGFIRTCVKAMPEELLKDELHDIIVALLPWARDSRNHFKSRVRACVELLVRRMGKTTILEQMPEDEKGLLDQILNAEPVKTDEQLVKEMEEEIEKFEPNEEDEQEIIEIDEAGNVIGQKEESMDGDFAALLQEIANSEDLKRAVKRREMWQKQEEEETPSKKRRLEEEDEEMEVEEMEEEMEETKKEKKGKGKKEKKDKKGKKEKSKKEK